MTEQLDIDEAVRYLDAHAAGHSTGHCARSIRLALAAGGLRLTQHPALARQYGDTLRTNGFSRITVTPAFVPAKGDIVVIQNYEGGNVAGHVAMYSGREWLSDFRQRDMWSGPGYREHQPSYDIYRWTQ